MNIGISGTPGSFSEEAARTYCRTHKVDACDLDYLITFENVLAALDAGEIEKGIFPIENSTGGIVHDAVEAMSKHIFNIEKYFEIDVHHNLIVKPGTTASHVTKVVSQDPALRQCRMYLKRKWPNVDVGEYPDTAKAAQDLAAGELSDTTAVIASRAAAELYDLEILEESIQDLKFNFTVFIVATK